MTEVKISNWGNSKVVRIPKEILSKLNLFDDQKLDISVKGQEIRLRAKEHFPDTIQEIFEEYDVSTKFDSEELEWGNPQGEEIW